METEGKVTDPKVIQPAEDMETEYNKRPPQSTANKVMDKREFYKPMQKLSNFTRRNWDGSIENQTGYVISRTL